MAWQHADPAVTFNQPTTIEEWLTLGYRQRHGLLHKEEHVPDDLSFVMANSRVATKDALLRHKEALEAVQDRCVVSRTHASFLAEVIGRMP